MHLSCERIASSALDFLNHVSCRYSRCLLLLLVDIAPLLILCACGFYLELCHVGRSVTIPLTKTIASGLLPSLPAVVFSLWLFKLLFSASTIKRHAIFENLLKFSDQDCVTNAYPPNTSKVGWEVVNLDLPADQRYNDLAGKKTKQLFNLLNYIKNFTSFILDGKLFGFVDKDLGPLADTLPAPYGDEIKGLAKATGIPLGEVVLYNIFYEVFTVCTSIVAEDKTGNLFHARNLDFGLFLGWDQKTNTWMLSEILRPLIVNIDYQRNGKTVYKTVSFAGYVGVLSGMKPGVMTLTLNERFNINGGYIGKYNQALDMLANEEGVSSQSITFLGNKIRRECLNPDEEPNYEQLEAKPLVVDDRRTPGGFIQRDLIIFCPTQPVLNKLTTYTTLMQASNWQHGDIHKKL
ncbi:N-acylsphingosine amidohydrolase [Desmophyllum pertusum]|uniref:ceramidase n=1 Tax=Desmophyllum pertusum TaxID=174260 RepID=A0A9W9ZL93_9CNID|nr:N-acylsphingosine amidohydrolase [Desmophyllum pertusum]